MRSEVTRIAGNYLRLIAGFIIGLLMVRQLLHYGSDIFNIFTIVTVGAGVGIMLRELLRVALTSHLSEAWAARERGGGEEGFRQVFGQSTALSTVCGIFGLCFMAMLALAVPSLEISLENIDAARAFIGSRAVIMAVAVITSPLLTMLLVMQQFGRMNTLLTLERFTDFAAVLAPMVLLKPGFEGGTALTVFSLVSVFLTCPLFIFAAWRVYRSAPALLRPTWRWKGAGPRGALIRSMLWALALIVSFNLYLRFDTFFINTHFGTAATIAFGLAVQLVGMVRQLTSGIVTGLDAVVARWAFEDGGSALANQNGKRILALNSYLQTTLTLAAILFLAVGAKDVLLIWVGDRVHDPQVLATTASLSTIMLCGVGARSLSEGWMAALNGQGRIGTYVRYTLLVTFFNPIILLIGAALWGKVLPLELVAWIFTILLTISHAVIVPLVYRREGGGTLRSLMAPILRGMAALPIACALSLRISVLLSEESSMLRAFAIAGSIGMVYGIDVLWYLKNERKAN